MRVVANRCFGIAVGLAVVSVLVLALPAAAQQEFSSSCEDRLFALGETEGYSCKGLSDQGTFSDHCVCFSRETNPQVEPTGGSFIQFLPSDCRADAEGLGPVYSNNCACQAVGRHLRRSASYMCTGTIRPRAEGIDYGDEVFRGTNVGKVKHNGRWIWPGNGLNRDWTPPVASVFGCKRDSICQAECATCFDTCDPTEGPCDPCVGEGCF